MLSETDDILGHLRNDLTATDRVRKKQFLFLMCETNDFSLYKEEELALHSEVADGVEGLSAR